MRLKAGLIFLGATCGIFSVGYAFAPPAHSLPLFGHHVVTAFGPGHCLPSGVWQATLNVSADVDGGTATLDTSASSFHLAVPGSFQFTIAGDRDTYTVGVRVAWPDGFVSPPASQPAFQVTATRPSDGCTPPPTSGVTTTTTCAQAIPPRSDCGGTTSPTPTSSTPSSIPSATSPTSPPTSTAPTIPTSATSAPKPSKPSATTYVGVSASLPVTGTGSTIVWVAVAILAVGNLAILITVRRRRP